MKTEGQAVASYPAPTRNQVRRDHAATAAGSLEPGQQAIDYINKRLNVGVDTSISANGFLSFMSAAEAANDYLPLTGGALTGPLTLQANAAAAMQPTTLQQMNAALGNYSTTAQMNAAISAASLLPLNNTWTGINTYNQSVQINGSLGIGKAPSYAIDVSQNLNAAVEVSIANPNAGGAADAGVSATNGTHGMFVGITGTGYTTNNYLAADTAYLLDGAAAGGLILGAQSAAGGVKFLTGGAINDQFDKRGYLGMGLNHAPNPAYDVPIDILFSSTAELAVVVANSYGTAAAPGTSASFHAQNDVNNYVMMRMTGSKSTGWPGAGLPDQSQLIGFGTGGMVVGSGSNAPLNLVVNQAAVATFTPGGVYSLIRAGGYPQFSLVWTGTHTWTWTFDANGFMYKEFDGAYAECLAPNGIIAFGATNVAGAGGSAMYFKTNAGGGYGLWIDSTATGHVNMNSRDIQGNANKAHIYFSNSSGVVGSIYTNGAATVFNTASDYRMKDVQGEADTALSLARINKLPLYMARFKGDEMAFRTMVLAHEVEELWPYAVTGEKDAMHQQLDADGVTLKEPEMMPQMIDYGQLGAPEVLAAIQELTKRIVALENRSAR